MKTLQVLGITKLHVVVRLQFWGSEEGGVTPSFSLLTGPH